MVKYMDEIVELLDAIKSTESEFVKETLYLKLREKINLLHDKIKKEMAEQEDPMRLKRRAFLTSAAIDPMIDCLIGCFLLLERGFLGILIPC